MIRTIAVYTALLTGLVLTFAGFFAVIGVAYLFHGLIAALVCFCGLAFIVTTGISALFMAEKDELEEAYAAPEGANVVSLRNMGKVS